MGVRGWLVGKHWFAVKRHAGSLRWRVTLGATAILIGALTIAALASAGLVRRSLTQDLETTLDDRIDEVETLARAHTLPAVLEPTGREVGQVQVISSSGAVISGTAGLAQQVRFDLIAAPAVGRERAVTVNAERIDGDKGERFRLVVRKISLNDQELSVWAVSSLQAATNAQRYLRNGLLLGLPLVAFLTMILISRVLDRALASVDAMRAEVDRIEMTDLSSRVTATESDDEIARLAVTLNRLLERVDQAAASQRLFAAAASHELRSPLSAIRTELEVGLAYPDRAEWPAIARDALDEIDRLELLSRELRVLTRVRDRRRSDVAVDLAEIVTAEVRRRQPKPEVTITTSLSDLHVMGDVDAILEVFRNLLDNAERHARTTINVTAVAQAQQVELAVANDGPPIPVDQRDRIFEPFMRLDEARSVDDGGSGLGLAIARATMIELGGTLRLADEVPGTGATFVARFRLGPS